MPSLDPDRWQAVSAYLDQALDLDDTERSAWLAALAERNPEIAATLRQLLAEHRAILDEGFLDDQPARPSAAVFAGQTIGPYTLVAPIGHGGMGSVWLAERSDGRFDRRVAVKFLSIAVAGRGEQRFKREGALLARLTHPHIAQLLDAGVSPTHQPYLILEHVDGVHIDRYCEQRQLDAAARVRLLLDVIDAIAHAHANLIVHRDLKPSNVLVTGDGQVKLVDFGIAALLEDEARPEGATLPTRDGGLALTPAFAAPEQLTGGAITTATDVYALGVLLYVLLTGEHPSGCALDSPAAIVTAIVETEPQRLPRGDLGTILATALKKRPGERYPSATALGEDLRRWLRHEPIAARPDTLGYRAAKFVRRNRTAVALAALALVAIAAGVIGTLVQAHTAQAERDFAMRELSRAEAFNDLNTFVLSDAAPSGRSFTVDDLLARAERIVSRQQNDAAGQLELLFSIGRQYAGQEEYAKARGLLETAYARSRTLADPSLHARAACALAQAVAMNGDGRRGETLFQEGLDALPDRPPFALDRVFCLERGAEVAEDTGSAADGVSRAEAAARALDRSPYRSELMSTENLVVLAAAYTHAGRLEQASQAYAQAASRLTALGRDQTERAATVFNNWGVALWQLGRSRESANALEHAIAITSDSRGERSVPPMSLVNYARALNDLDRFDEAAGYAERGYARAHAIGNETAAGQALLVRASIERRRGHLDASRRALDELDAQLRRTLPPGHIAFAALTIQRAQLAEAAGDLRGALELANRAVAAGETASAGGRQGSIYLRQFLGARAHIELGLGQIDRAVADARRALELMQASSEPGATSREAGLVNLTLGDALQAQGRHDDAKRAFAVAAAQLARALGPEVSDSRRARDLAAQ